jgi:hypothetical protein
MLRQNREAVVYDGRMHKRIWFGAAAGVTIALGVLYGAIQQTLRLSADEPQSSMVTQTAALLRQNGDAHHSFDGHIEIAYNQAPFVIVYDTAGNVVAGNGYLDGTVPRIPIGVLQHIPSRGEHRVTWEPRSGVRIATVSARAGTYYVVGGRSLQTTESHMRTVNLYAGATWIASMAILTSAYLFVVRGRK